MCMHKLTRGPRKEATGIGYRAFRLRQCGHAGVDDVYLSSLHIETEEPKSPTKWMTSKTNVPYTDPLTDNSGKVYLPGWFIFDRLKDAQTYIKDLAGQEHLVLARVEWAGQRCRGVTSRSRRKLSLVIAKRMRILSLTWVNMKRCANHIVCNACPICGNKKKWNGPFKVQPRKRR